MMVVKQINGQSEGWFGAKDLKEDSHIWLEDEEEPLSLEQLIKCAFLLVPKLEA